MPYDCIRTTLFYENNLKEHEAHFCSKFKKQIKNNLSLRRRTKSFKFSIEVVNKTAASAAQFAKCILFHTYSCTYCSCEHE